MCVTKSVMNKRPSPHHHLGETAGRRLCDIRRPRAGLSIEALHHSVTLTPDQQVTLVPRQTGRPRKMPRLALGMLMNVPSFSPVFASNRSTVPFCPGTPADT